MVSLVSAVIFTHELVFSAYAGPGLRAKSIRQATPEVPAHALSMILEAHAPPVFGAAKAVEHEVAALRVLQRLCVISSGTDQFEMLMIRRFTRAKEPSQIHQ